MSDETYSFSTAKSRLDEIVVQVRKKDTSLEKSLDLLEEGVRLANACTELIDHADWTTTAEGAACDASVAEAGATAGAGAAAAETDAALDDAADSEAASAAETTEAAENPAATADAEFAADDDAYGDAADEAWANTTPDFADEDALDEPDAGA